MTTLKSVIGQKDVSFEVIVADDGSPVDYFRELEDYLSRMPEVIYTLVKNQQNQGTVLNCISGLEKAKGKYVKLISPGDYLADERTLKILYDEMEAGNLTASFSEAVYYRSSVHDTAVVRTMPQEKEAYRKGKLNLQKSYYLVLNDKVCGATWFTRTEILKKYMARIAGKVIYSEDSAYRLMLAENIKFGYQDMITVFYQYGEGISTSNSEAWIRRLHQDDVETNKILMETLGKAGDRFNRKLVKYLAVQNEQYRKKTNIYKLLHFPGASIRWLVMKIRPRYSPTAKEFGFIDRCLKKTGNEG